ncbi:MAG TPA: hypothetical protein DIV86_04130 [Alphaproteobacteria bacterium]|nr:hypothetical protein [Alphaproteobacteria bacterium]
MYQLKKIGFETTGIVNKGSFMKTIYVEMIADLFHYGHVEFLRKAKSLGDRLVVGVLSDEWATKYKKTPIMNWQERGRVVEACKYVDEVLLQAEPASAKWYEQTQYIQAIAFRDEVDRARHKAGSIGHDMSRKVELPYEMSISTTDIIKRVKDREKAERKDVAIIRKFFAPRWQVEEWMLAEQILRDVGQVFAEHDILYFLAFGSHIGAVRHQGPIPWDDDIDIAITEKDEERLKALAPQLRKLGYNILLYKGVNDGFTDIYYKICLSSRPYVQGREHSWPFVDVFVLRHSKSDPELCGLDRRQFPETNIFPLKQGKFGSLTVPVPNNDGLLKILYANDYMATCVSTSFDHRKDKLLKNIVRPKQKIIDAGCFINVHERAEKFFNSVPVAVSGWVLKEQAMKISRNAVELQLSEFQIRLLNAINGKRTIGDLFDIFKGPRAEIMNRVFASLNAFHKYNIVT